MNTTATYRNRYGDNIIFTQEGNKIIMTGYEPNWLGCSYENDYDDAYLTYINDNKGVFDCIDFLPYHYVDGKKTLLLSQQEFIKHLFEYDSELKEYKCPDKYRKLVKTSDRIHNVDPSGGPYISLGTNLKRDFKDGIDRIITHIDIQPNSIIFTIK